MVARTRDLSQQVYDRLREAILTSELLPGHKLSHQALTKRLGVSHTPLREALSQLSREGYVQHIQNRGYFVADSTRLEVEELLDIREALEFYVLKRLKRPLPGTGLRALHSTQSSYQRAVALGSALDRLRCDRKFHLTLAGFTGNRTLTDQLGQVFDRINLKRRINGLSPSRGRQALEEHKALMSALKGKDFGRARAALERHLKKNRENILERMQEGASSLRPVQLPTTRPAAGGSVRHRNAPRLRES